MSNTDTDQSQLPPWLMGSLAAQDNYTPPPPAPMPIGNPMGEAAPPAPANWSGDWNPVPQYLASLQSNNMGTIGKDTIDAIRRTHQTGVMSPEDEATIQQGAGLGMGFAGTVKNVGRAAMGDLAGPIRAYHGSPYDFNQFDLSKIGTGEGAQAYGHGLYFAQNPAVAASYKTFVNQLPTNPERLAALYLSEHGSGALQAMQRDLSGKGDFYVSDTSNYAPALKLLSSGWKPPGHMYEVNINADPAQMLDFNKPLREQSKAVQDVFPQEFSAYRAVPNPSGVTWQVQHPGGWIPNAAQNFYRSEAAARADAELLNQYRVAADIVPRTPEQASRFRQAGIPGIKYLDQGSRAAGTGSSNYVVFDPSIIQIMRKYGLAGAVPAAGAMGGLAAQDNYQPGD